MSVDYGAFLVHGFIYEIEEENDAYFLEIGGIRICQLDEDLELELSSELSGLDHGASGWDGNGTTWIGRIIQEVSLSENFLHVEDPASSSDVYSFAAKYSISPSTFLVFFGN